jgi:hypothetical protein
MHKIVYRIDTPHKFGLKYPIVYINEEIAFLFIINAHGQLSLHNPPKIAL